MYLGIKVFHFGVTHSTELSSDGSCVDLHTKAHTQSSRTPQIQKKAWFNKTNNYYVAFCLWEYFTNHRNCKIKLLKQIYKRQFETSSKLIQVLRKKFQHFSAGIKDLIILSFSYKRTTIFGTIPFLLKLAGKEHQIKIY